MFFVCSSQERRASRHVPQLLPIARGVDRRDVGRDLGAGTAALSDGRSEDGGLQANQGTARAEPRAKAARYLSQCRVYLSREFAWQDDWGSGL